jgi:hypothetical protein
MMNDTSSDDASGKEAGVTVMYGDLCQGGERGYSADC